MSDSGTVGGYRHLAVMMVANGVEPEEVNRELARRAGGNER